MPSVQYLGTKNKISTGCSSCGASVAKSVANTSSIKDIYYKNTKYSFKKGEIKQVPDETALYLLKIHNNSLPAFRLIKND